MLKLQFKNVTNDNFLNKKQVYNIIKIYMDKANYLNIKIQVIFDIEYLTFIADIIINK